MHILVSILQQTPLPSGLPHNIEQSSVRYTVGPCWLSILNIAVCTRTLMFFNWSNVSSVRRPSICVYLMLPYDLIQIVHFGRRQI